MQTSDAEPTRHVMMQSCMTSSLHPRPLHYRHSSPLLYGTNSQPQVPQLLICY